MDTMHTVYKNAMLAGTLEILSLPVFRFVGGSSNGLFFWIVLILMDSFLLRHLSFFGLLKMQRDPHYKKEKKQLFVLQILFIIGLCILVFSSWQLAGILLLNDIVVDVLSFMIAMKEKKTK